MTAAAKLFGCFKGGQCVLGKIAKKSEGMVFGAGMALGLSVAVCEVFERGACAWLSGSRNAPGAW